MTEPELAGRLRGNRQITDAHLVALARSRGGRLVTFDASLSDLDDGRTVVQIGPD